MRISPAMASFSAAIDKSIIIMKLIVSKQIILASHYYLLLEILTTMNKQKCIACHQIPDSLLQLSCDHCICLPCAAKHIEATRNDNYFITCLKCTETTELQDQLFRQLTPYKGKALLKRQQNVLNKEKIVRNDRQGELKTNTSSLERVCEAHEQYAIMYVCKTCNDVFICPECVINGSHKNHEATVIQKEGERIKNKLQQELAKINGKVEELEKMESARLAIIEQRKQDLQRLRSLAIKQYNEIKEAIKREESAVISKCSELIASHQREEANFRMEIAAQIESYESQRIHLIDLLNPLLEESIVGQSRAIQKMLMVNLVDSYKTFNKVCQRNKENYIRIAERQMEEDLEVINSLTKKIDKISIGNFYQTNKRDKPERGNDKVEIMENIPYQRMERQFLNKQITQHQNDFFRLL